MGSRHLTNTASTKTPDTPRTLGYRMPAEWERHQSTWIAWPHNRSDWPGKFDPIPWVYADMVRHLARAEDVNIIVHNAATRAKAREALTRSHVDQKFVKFHLWPTDRGWTRDSGPIFLVRESNKDRVAVTDWRFNAWAKYPNWKRDDKLPERIAKNFKLNRFTPTVMAGKKPYRVVLEGGSIDVNGQGMMITTEECHLSKTQQRNPGLSREDLERVFSEYLAVDKVIWLDRGIAGDDTHGHVDDISRFVSPDTVLTAVEHSRGDANYEPLQENLRRLRAATDLHGRKLHVVELPLPRPVVFRGQRLPASYANFYIANDVVLVPTFNDPNDRLALNIIAGVLPRHEVVGI
ncbi:MAG TPA: agmatine deiminase family protein, partial [Candidatus Limnocylindrales bacterium]|nr:agmatine deiminase family protein [Candidatus Limnocylindrales bacterium]